MALCGVMTALGVLILSLGSLIPAATFCCPVLASYLLVILIRECGTVSAMTAFSAMAILGILLAPDKEIAGLFLALGYYPALKRVFERLSGFPGWLMKLLWFNAATLALYALLIFVLKLEALTQEFRQTRLWLTVVTLVLGNAVFILYDIALNRLETVYERRRKRIK